MCNTYDGTVKDVSPEDIGDGIMKYTGFSYDGKRIFYVEARGKDISFDRWRFNLYYEPNMARLHFEPNEAAAEIFIEKTMKNTYQNFHDFRLDWCQDHDPIGYRWVLEKTA